MSGSTEQRKNRDREVAAGDSYLWRWHGYLDDVMENGIITAANGIDRSSSLLLQTIASSR